MPPDGGCHASPTIVRLPVTVGSEVPLSLMTDSGARKLRARSELGMVIVSASGVALDWVVAERRVPAEPSSSREASVKLAGASRSSSASSRGRKRAGALRIVRGLGANRLRIQVRAVMEISSQEGWPAVQWEDNEPGAQTGRPGAVGPV